MCVSKTEICDHVIFYNGYQVVEKAESLKGGKSMALKISLLSPSSFSSNSFTTVLKCFIRPNQETILLHLDTVKLTFLLLLKQRE